MRTEDTSPAGLRLPVQRVRDERLAVALQMLQLTIKDGAGWPVPAQETLRQAVCAVQRLQAWCRTHGRADL